MTIETMNLNKAKTLCARYQLGTLTTKEQAELKDDNGPWDILIGRIVDEVFDGDADEAEWFFEFADRDRIAEVLGYRETMTVEELRGLYERR